MPNPLAGDPDLARRLSESRLREFGGGVVPVRLPPDELLPSKARKQAKDLARLEAEVKDRSQELGRLKAGTPGLTQDHQNEIAQAMRSGKPLPEDPTPKHMAAIRDAENVKQGAILAHNQTAEELWKVLQAEAEDSITNLSMAADNAAIDLAGELMLRAVDAQQLEQFQSAISFYKTVGQRRAYSDRRGEMSRTLQKVLADVTALTPAAKEWEASNA